MQTDTKQLREFCEELVRHGIEVARQMQSKHLPRKIKEDRSPVTEADLRIERELIERINEEFPADAIIGEESAGLKRGAEPAEAERFWIIDPIDGTRSYARGMPWFSCSVAVTDRRAPIAGAVAEACSGMVFAAEAGRGAWLGEERLEVMDEPLSRDTSIAVSSAHALRLPEAVIQWPNTYVVRNFGSAALHFAMVASGMVDAALSMECRVWDVAAAALLVTEAGGIITDRDGKDLFPMDIPAQALTPQPLAIFAGGRTCHAALLPAVQSRSQAQPRTGRLRR